MWKRQLIFTIVLLTTVGIISLTHFLEAPLEDWCTTANYLPSNRPTTSVHAVKVVVNPLHGRHQAYGIFMVPREKCFLGKPVVLTVIGAGHYCEVAGSFGKEVRHFQGVDAPPGYYLTRHYIRTRTTLWLTTQGYLDRLKQHHNWTLTYVE